VGSIVISIGKIGENIVTSNAPHGSGTRRFHAAAAVACAKGRGRQIADDRRRPYQYTILCYIYTNIIISVIVEIIINLDRLRDTIFIL